MTTIKVMIINNKNNYFKFTITSDDFDDGLAVGDSNKACLKAIDKYLESVPKFGIFCSVTKTFWESVTKNTQSDINIRVSYANGFCTKDRYRIKNVMVIDEEYPAEA